MVSTMVQKVMKTVGKIDGFKMVQKVMKNGWKFAGFNSGPESEEKMFQQMRKMHWANLMLSKVVHRHMKTAKKIDVFKMVQKVLKNGEK